MQDSGLRSLISKHHMFLNSIAEDFIHKKRSLPDVYPRMQVLKNEISITYDPPPFNREDIQFNSQDFKSIIDGLTKKIRLYRIKGLESFSINFIRCRDMPSESLRYLKQNLMKHFQGLKHLALNFYEVSIIAGQGMGEMIDLVLSLKDLESLQIRFFVSSRGKDGHLEALIKQVQKSQRLLKKIDISISELFHRKHDDMQFIKRDFFQRITFDTNGYQTRSTPLQPKKWVLKACQALTKNFQGLQCLNLTLIRLYILVTDECCLELGKGILERMERLESLKLDFSGCIKLTNDAMSLFHHANPSRIKLRALEHLTLNFSGIPEANELGLKKLGEGVSLQFKDLKEFALAFHMDDNVSDDSLVEFNAMITSNLRSLQSLTLASGQRKERSKECIQKMSQDIVSNLGGIKELRLMCSKIGLNELSAISSDLEKSGIKLEKLHLSSMRPILNLQALQATSLKDLTELKLDFSSLVYEKMIRDFEGVLNTMTKLKRLALIFTECYNLIKPERSSLVPFIPKASVLETYEISFKKYRTITDKLFDDFGTSLCQYQKGLYLLNLNFSGCSEITERTFERFCMAIKLEMKRMQHLTLHFDEISDYQIPERSKNAMRVYLKEIPAVSLY